MMITEIEQLLSSHEDWRPFRRLYNHVKSAIHYSAGLQGRYHQDVAYNIETLVNTLHELERNEEHPIYPFIASWNSRFLDLAGRGFDEIRMFRELILKKLKGWMCPEDVARSSYYGGLQKVQQHLNYSLRVFSLNYDLNVEGKGSDTFRVETGFAGYGPEHAWDLQRFAEFDTGDPLPEVFLYKLHGSINWKRDPLNYRLYQVPQVESVEAKSMEVIFGREFKLEAGDPYLFYTYEFRRLTAESKLILSMGYGFADPHINKILTQALREEGGPILHVVTLADGDPAHKGAEIALLLEVPPERVTVSLSSAMTFLGDDDVGANVASMIPSEPDPFRDVAGEAAC